VAWNPDEQAIVQAALVDKKAPHAISKIQDGSPSQGLFKESSPINQTNLGIVGGRNGLAAGHQKTRGRRPQTTHDGHDYRSECQSRCQISITRGLAKNRKMKERLYMQDRMQTKDWALCCKDYVLLGTTVIV
jgi:hypothetical protein